MKQYDVIIIGAGAAGLSAGATAIARGKSVLIMDMGDGPARKVLASGGGRCNITNTAAGRDRYFGQNPDFVRGALSRVTPYDILKWADSHKLKLTQKEPGRYFCEDGSMAVVNALMHDVRGADIKYNCTIDRISKTNNIFWVNGYCATSVIIATGGTSFGTLGVSDAGQKIAKSFGHKIIPMRPGLCALAISGATPELAGITLDAEITIGKKRIADSLLITHFGIGGPATYRASLHDLKEGIRINLAPGIDVLNLLREAKQTQGRKNVATILGTILPTRIAKWVAGNTTCNIADIKDNELKNIAKNIQDIDVPANKIKYHTLASAEVVCGGVCTDEISSKTMESKLCSGLFFAGEVMDIAGDLGGFNLQWAWASGRVAGDNA